MASDNIVSSPLSLTNTMILTGVTVVAGRWAEGKPFGIQAVIPVGFMAFMLILLGSWNADLASGLGLIILVSALLMYGKEIIGSLGLGK